MANRDDHQRYHVRVLSVLVGCSHTHRFIRFVPPRSVHVFYRLTSEHFVTLLCDVCASSRCPLRCAPLGRGGVWIIVHILILSRSSLSLYINQIRPALYRLQRPPPATRTVTGRVGTFSPHRAQRARSTVQGHAPARAFAPHPSPP